MAETDHVFYRSQRKTLPLIDHGEGIYLFDSAGNRYIDASSGALVSNIGHCIPEVIAAMTQQAKIVEYVHGTQFKHEPGIALAQRLSAMAPGDLNRVYFVSGGSEANETAVKMARAYHTARGEVQKHLVISRWNSYHGATLGALSMGGRTMSRKMYQPYLLDFPHIPPTYCYRCPYRQTPESCDFMCARELESLITRLGPEYISAFIAEPVVGAALTVVPPPPGYFRIIRKICDKYDILFIADEVMTALGRTGKNFGIDHDGVVPDIITGAKGLGAGYFPIGVVICRERIFREFQDKLGKFIHGFTYQGNPLAAAVGLSILDYMRDNDLIERVARTGCAFIEKISSLDRFDFVGDVRGIGYMAGIEFVRDKRTRQPLPLQIGFTRRIAEAAWERGLILYPSGSTGQVAGIAGDGIMIAPPLITTEDQINAIIDRLADTLESVCREVKTEM